MRILLIGLLLFILVSCQPGLREERRSMRTGNSIDSSLYYPAKTVHDPFLDSLKSPAGSKARIYLTLLPPPFPPPPAFTLVGGFRIQLFAGIDSLNVRALYEQTRKVVPDSVYFIKEGGLYKIQIGDFIIRNKADLRLLQLRQKDLKNMWVVAREIKQPVRVALQADSLFSETENRKFSLQILVTGDKKRAEALIRQLRARFDLEAYSRPEGTVYKIYLGHFATHAQADSVLQDVRKKGYPDAWVFYRKP